MARITAGAALVARLGRLGVKYIFAESPADAPDAPDAPREAAADLPAALRDLVSGARDTSLPRVVLAGDTAACLAMAHGFTLATGQPQAALLADRPARAGPGLARADAVPMLILTDLSLPSLAARRPAGVPCKWQARLRAPGQIHDLLDRAHAIACSDPRGPVVLALPRAMLATTVDLPQSRPQARPARPAARAADIEAAARRLAGARHPVIFARRGAGSDTAFTRLSETVERWAIPVCQGRAQRLAIPTDHPMAAGSDPPPLLAEADVILVLDTPLPWAPDAHAPRPEAVVIQTGPDPLFVRAPMRGIRVDLALPGDPGETVLALCAALDRLEPGDRIARRVRVATTNAAAWERRDARVARDGAGAASGPDRAGQSAAPRPAASLADDDGSAPKPASRTEPSPGMPHTRPRVISLHAAPDPPTKGGPPLTRAWLSDRIARLSRDRPVTIFGEFGARLSHMRLSDPQAWFDAPPGGGPGFGLPAALGYHLANPERLTVAMLGDAAWAFSDPRACLQVARDQGLSVLVLVVDSPAAIASSRASRRQRSRPSRLPLIDLAGAADPLTLARACGALGLRAATVDGFTQLLSRATSHVTAGQGTVIIDTRILPLPATAPEQAHSLTEG